WVTDLSGKIVIHTLPPRLILRVIAIRAASIWRLVTHPASSDFRPYSPNCTRVPPLERPARRPRWTRRYFVRFGRSGRGPPTPWPPWTRPAWTRVPQPRVPKLRVPQPRSWAAPLRWVPAWSRPASPARRPFAGAAGAHRRRRRRHRRHRRRQGRAAVRG